MGDINQFFVDNGAVEELEFNDELSKHLAEQEYYSKHQVTLTEILEVHLGRPRYFDNRAGKRAPVIMLGPTTKQRLLCIPIERADWQSWSGEACNGI